MNITRHFLCLCALGLTATAPSARAQAGPPDFVDYQGTVFDANGKPLGSSGSAPDWEAAPANYTMQFKIWSAPTGGTLIWAESQTVTVSLGTFSVRLGSGVAISGLTPAPTTAAISSAFAAKERYLGVTVIFPSQTVHTEITPRLAFQSAPFAFVAKSVNGVVNATAGSTFAANIIDGTALKNNSVTGSALADLSVTSTKLANSAVNSAQIVDGAISTADLANNAVSSAQILNGSITSADIADGTIGTADVDATLGLWNRSGNDLSWNNGKIGIGTGTPLTNLHVIGTTTYDHIRLDAGPGTLGAFLTLNATGIQNGRHHRIFSTGGAAGEGPGKLVFQDASGGGNIMTLATNTVGFGTTREVAVGIGTTAPETTLEVASNDEFHALRIRNNLHQGHAWDVYVELESGDAQGVFVIKPWVGGASGAYLSTTGTWKQPSDLRLKKQILPMDSPLAGVMRLRPVTYRFKTETDDAERHVGLIAQEVEEVYPEVVSECSGIKGIAYAELSSVAIGAIQELKKEKDVEIKARDEKIAALEQRLAALEQRMGHGVAAEGDAVK